MAIPSLFLNTFLKSAKGLHSSFKVGQNAATRAMHYVDQFPDLAKKVLNARKITNKTLSEVVDTGYSRQRQSFYDQTVGSVMKQERPIEGLHGLFESKIKSVSGQSVEVFNSFVSNIEMGMQKSGGRNLLSFYRLALKDPVKLRKLYGFTNEDIFRALFAPETVKNPTLRALGEAIKGLDDPLVKRVQNMSTSGLIDDFKVPLSPNPNVIESLGEKKFAEVIFNYTALTEKQANRIASNYMKSLAKRSARVKAVKFNVRDLTFQEGEQGLLNKFKFFEAVSGINDDNAGILERYIHHRGKMIENALYYKEFGKDPQTLMSKAYSKVMQGKKDDELKEISKSLSRNSHRLDTALGTAFTDSSTLRFYMESIDKLISATYGAPASSIRNYGIDYTFHGLSIKEALLTGEGAFGFMYNRFLRPMWFSVSSAKETILGQGGKFRESMNDLLDVFDFGITNNSMFSTRGIRGENFYGEMLDIKNVKSYPEKIGRILNEGMGNLNVFMHKITGNNAQFDSTTAINLYNTSAFFSNMILKSVDYDTFLNSMGKKGVQYLDWMFGIDKNVFNALKESFTTIADDVKVSNVKKILGFNDIKILLPKTISKMDDSIANKYKLVEETAEVFKERVRIAYHSLLTHQRNMTQTTLHSANLLVDEGLTRGSFIELLLRPFAKFGNITHAQQYDGLRTGMSIALYGNPFQTGYGATMANTQGMGHWARAFAFYFSGSVATIWAKDMLQGRHPRGLDKKQSFLIAASSGIGGVPFMVGTQSFYSGHKASSSFYGASPLGDMITDGVDVIKKLTDEKGVSQRDRFSTAKFIQKASGVGRVWWMRGLVDGVLRHKMLDRRERIAIENWYETELKSKFF